MRRRRTPRTSATSGVIGAAVAVGLVAVAVVALVGRRRDTPPPIESTPSTDYAAPADAERTTWAQAARTLSWFKDPADAGPIDLVVEFRRLAEAIEAGRRGPAWPTFRGDLASCAWKSRDVAYSATQVDDKNERAAADHVRTEFDAIVRALDVGDVGAARMRFGRWSAAFQAFARTYLIESAR